jgi:acylglycerol lipase
MIRTTILAAFLLLGACAPMAVQSPLDPEPGFGGARLEGDVFVSFDGAHLGLSTWEAEGEPWAVIIGLHGMNDHSGSFWLAGPHWAEQGITSYAYDQRGYGRSPDRGIWAGEDLITEDLRTMADLARARHPDAVIAVVGVSMGGAAATAAFASDDPPDADRLVLLAPAVWGWSTQSLPASTSLWITGRVAPGWKLEPPAFLTRDRWATDNEVELRRMANDPLMVWGARTDTLYGLMNLMEDAWKSTGELEVPTLYLYGYEDQIIPRRPSVQAASRLKPGDKTGFYRDGFHMLLADKQAWRVWNDVAGFIRNPGGPLVSGVAPIPEM